MEGGRLRSLSNFQRVWRNTPQIGFVSDSDPIRLGPDVAAGTIHQEKGAALYALIRDNRTLNLNSV